MLLDLFLVCFSLIFLFVPCGVLRWLHVSFLLHVKYTISYRTFQGFSGRQAACLRQLSFLFCYLASKQTDRQNQKQYPVGCHWAEVINCWTELLYRCLSMGSTKLVLRRYIGHHTAAITSASAVFCLWRTARSTSRLATACSADVLDTADFFILLLHSELYLSDL